MKISGVTAIKDEVRTYEKSLKSLTEFVDEIIVADIGMEPELKKAVSRMSKVRVLSIKKPVPFIELIRQDMIDSAKGEWVLLFDPDEVFPKTLTDELSTTMEKYDHVTIPRKNIILGYWMEHSRWWPDSQVRFFKKGSVSWSTVIHSKPKLKGKGYALPSEETMAIEHYNYLDYDEYMSKSRRYARAEAQGYIDRSESLTIMMALKRGVSEFMSRFFADNGYKDGTPGFIMAFSQLMYYFQVYVYFWEMTGKPTIDEKTLTRIPSQIFSHALNETLHWSRAKKIVTDPASKIKAALLKRL